MKTEVIANDHRTADDSQQLHALSLAVYGPEEDRDDEFARVSWASTQISAIVRREGVGDIVAHAGVLLRNGLLDGAAVRIGGVGGVKTHPEVRGQRLGKAVMSRAVDVLRDDLSADFGLLVCADLVLPYYQQLGWQTFPGELWVDQPEGRVRFNVFCNTMVIAGRQPAPTGGVIDLQGRPW